MQLLTPYSAGQLLGCDEKGVVLSANNTIVRHSESHNGAKVLAAINEEGPSHFWDKSAFLSRVTRSGYHSFIETESYKFVLKNSSIFSGNLEDYFLKKTFEIPRGRRPLNFCRTPSNNVYFGEYFGNNTRDSVFVYGTEDGHSWSRIYEFSKGKIRHIHGLFWDDYRSGIWILTGDSNAESALWFTNDEFNNVEYIAGGSQKYRVVSIIIKENGLYIPMDSPLEKNFLHFLDLNSMRLKVVTELPNSVFDIVNYDNFQLLTTVPEPSKINNSRHVFLKASVDCENWVDIESYQGDFCSQNISKRLFQYPRLKLCNGVYNGTIFGFARALAGITCGIVSISSESLKSRIKGN